MDTADTYCSGPADLNSVEKLIAECVKEHGISSSSMVVATKGGMGRSDTTSKGWCAKHVTEASNIVYHRPPFSNGAKMQVLGAKHVSDPELKNLNPILFMNDLPGQCRTHFRRHCPQERGGPQVRLNLSVAAAPHGRFWYGLELDLPCTFLALPA